jgi:hypothetical protein
MRKVQSFQEGLMPVEIIGEFGTAGADREWLRAQGELAIQHLNQVCGEPPPEMELEIVWQEHDLGNYPVIGLVWEDSMRGTPRDYVARCQTALDAYEFDGDPRPGDAVPSTASDNDADESGEDWEDFETPPTLPANASALDIYTYTCQLNQWALEASERNRHRPRLVGSDDDQPSQT